jgi:ubiquinone/menaquinone biosynthesis C-methylase UbiE
MTTAAVGPGQFNTAAAGPGRFSTGSAYDPERITAGGLAGEITRLEAQARLTFAEELRILIGLGLPDSGPLVDLGCGTGSAARRIRAALPGLPVVGLDISMALLSRAAGGGVTVAGAAASALPLRSGTAGSVLMRYLVQHLPEPGAALAEIRRVLRPGGLVAVVETDEELWGLAHPTFAELEIVHRKAAAARRSAGTDRRAARQLPRLLSDHGFTDIVVRPFAITNDQVPTRDFAVHLGPDQFAPLVAAGTISLADLSLAAYCWNRFRSDPDAWILLLGFIVAGRAPGGPARTSRRIA